MSSSARKSPSSPAWLLPAALALAVAAAVLPFLLRGAIRSQAATTAADHRGRAAFAIVGPGFFRAALVDDLRKAPDAGRAIRDAVPVIAVEGSARLGAGKAATPHALIYGVDERFWTFFDLARPDGVANDAIVIAPGLAEDLGVANGDAITITLPYPDDAPAGTLHARRTLDGRTLTGTIAISRDERLNGLSPLAGGQALPAIYAPLALLQNEALWHDRVNAILVASASDDAGEQRAALEALLPMQTGLDDFGLSLRIDDDAKAVVVDSRTGAMDDGVVDAVSRAAIDTGGLPTPVLTALVRRLRAGSRELAYSFISSLELQAVAPDVHAEELSHPPLVLNAWTAERLAVAPGDAVQVEYYVQRPGGAVETETSEFEVAGVIPMAGLALQPGLTPRLPGITGAPMMHAWTPRVPFETDGLTVVDEDYWAKYATTPKGFTPPQVGRALWRHGVLAATSVQVTPAEGATLDDARAQLEMKLRDRLAPAAVGMHVRALQMDGDAQADAAAAQTTPMLYAGLLAAVAVLLLGVAVGQPSAAQGHRATVMVLAGIVALSAGALLVRARQPGDAAAGTRASETGGFAVLAQTTRPLLADVSTVATGTTGRSTTFKAQDAGGPDSPVTAGPHDVWLAAVSPAFIDEGRFTFTGSMDRTDEERANPWLLLRREQRDASDPGAEAGSPIVPVVASAGALARLQARLGDDIPFALSGHAVRLRVVATLGSALFPDALFLSDADFTSWLPGVAGTRWFAVESTETDGVSATTALVERLTPLGVNTDRAETFTRHAARAQSRAWALDLGALLLALATLPIAWLRLR